MSSAKDIREVRRRERTVAKTSRHAGVPEPTVRKHSRQEDLSPSMPMGRQLLSIPDPLKPTIDRYLQEGRRSYACAV